MISNTVRPGLVRANLPTVIRTAEQATNNTSGNNIITLQTIHPTSNGNVRPLASVNSSNSITTQPAYSRTNQVFVQPRPNILIKQNSVPLVRKTSQPTTAAASPTNLTGISLLQRQASLPVTSVASPTIQVYKPVPEVDILASEEVKKFFETAVEEDEFANLNTFSDYMPAKRMYSLNVCWIFY